MSDQTITPALVRHVRAYLGDNGAEFFRNLLRDHGEINVVLSDGGIPHPVHFREGMRVRNAMRESGLCEGWNDHDFDDLWIRVVCHAILETPE
jgi:hypothetical protein